MKKFTIEGTVVVADPPKAVVRSFFFPVTDATRLVCRSSSVEFFVEGKSVYFYELKKILAVRRIFGQPSLGHQKRHPHEKCTAPRSSSDSDRLRRSVVHVVARRELGQRS